jgi:hypothetical protein
MEPTSPEDYSRSDKGLFLAVLLALFRVGRIDFDFGPAFGSVGIGACGNAGPKKTVRI